MPDKYTRFAPFYDALSGEWPVYRAGRVRGIRALQPAPGDQILDIGCGTGLNFASLQAGIGKTGRIVGIDSSAAMLRQARRRVQARGWTNVALIQADAQTMTAAELSSTLRQQGARPHSAKALATYSLSLMPHWHTAFDHVCSTLVPGGTICVVDMQRPLGAARALGWLAEAACRLGGSDITAHPWTAVEEQCTDVVPDQARGGHLQIRAGRIPLPTGNRSHPSER